MDNNNLKRYFQFLLIVLSAGSIYPVVYLKQTYQETILTVYNMSLSQLNTIFSVLGVVFLIGYFPSGLLSDKFSSKKLLSISLFGTAIGGFWFAQVPSYKNVILVFCIWGFFSVFTFWSAHMKLVKLLAKPEEQGRFFGILDGGRGVVEAVLGSIALIIFSTILGASELIADKRLAIVSIVYMYSSILLLVSILIAIFIEDDKNSVDNVEKETIKEPKNQFAFKDISLVFKNKFVFLLGGIIFMSYIVTWTVYYFDGFMETNIMVDSITASSIMVIILWMRPIGGILGGFLADKFGRTNILSSALLGAIFCLILISILPTNSNKVLFYALIVCGGAFIYAIRGTFWSLLNDCKIEDKIIGVAVGFISVLGYLPDILLPIFNSYLFTVFGDESGYNAYFISSAIFGLVGILLVTIFAKSLKTQK